MRHFRQTSLPQRKNLMKQYLTDKGHFIIRLGRRDDIKGLTQLNSKWCFKDLQDIDISNGFLFGKPFLEIEFDKIIQNSEITVAEINNEIAGYYLFDNFSNNETSLNYETKIVEIVKQGLLDKTKICRRAQVVVDNKYQGLGLYRELFNALNKHCKDKYDKIFSVVNRHNPKWSISNKMGWEIISEDGDYYNVCYDFKS